MRILLAEDEDDLREVTVKRLKTEGFGVDGCRDGQEALEYLDAADYNLVILDIMMPRLDGLSVLRKMRSGGNPVPVLLLTAKDAVSDRVQGLESGADDYVVKPFGIMELQARVKALLRRTGRNKTEEVIICGDLEIDPAAREVRKAGVPVELTYKEFELLKLLASRRGMVLSRDDILQAVWDYNFAGETRTVDMHVKTLRQKLGEGYIQTVRGVGYKMA